MSTSDADARRGLRRFAGSSQSVSSDPGRLRRLAGRAQTKLSKQKGEIATLRTDVPALLRLVRAYARGRYRRVPWKTITMAAGALLYFVAPVDLVPDFILGTGLLDDAAVVAFVIRSIRGDLEDFVVWEATEDRRAARAATGGSGVTSRGSL